MMMRLTKWFSAALAVTLLASMAAQAQQKGGQPQGQKGAPPVQGAAGQQGAYHGGYGQMPWFSNQDARTHLKLNDAQYNQLNKGYGQAYEGYQTGMKNMGKDLTDEQRTQKMGELQQGFNKNLSTTANDVFTDPQQRQRYNQLQMQYRGYNAFSDPTVQDKLNLTAEQRQKLGQQGQEWNKQMNGFGAGYKSDPEGTTKKFNEMRTQNGERINSVLTPDQQKSYQQMTGQSYNFQPSAYFQTNASAGAGTGTSK
jgi:hypothetical protein